MRVQTLHLGEFEDMDRFCAGLDGGHCMTKQLSAGRPLSQGEEESKGDGLIWCVASSGVEDVNQIPYTPR